MSDWKTCTLEDACDIFDGPHATPEKQDSGPYFLSISSLQNGHLDLSESAFISEEDYSEWTRRVIPRHEDIVFSYETRLGQAAMLPKGLRCCLGRRMGLLRSKDRSFADPHFLLHYYLGDPFQKVIKDNTVFGTTVDRIPLQKMGGFEIALPPLPEQKKIAEILSGIDNYIRRLRQQGRKLDVAKAALSKELISGSSEPTKESLYGQIPEHWKESSLGEAVGIENLQTGPFGSQLHAHEYTSEGIPVVMPQDMRDCRVVTNKIARITTDRAQSLEKHRVLTGDILFSRRGDIGRHAVIAENESGWICGTGCLRARTHGAINPVFLSELLRHKFALEWLNANAVGQTMLNLNTGILSGLPLVIPPKEEQDKIANSLSSINERSKKIGDQRSLAQNLKAAISSDLLSGRKRISV
jgi:type I restriction enzyme S subunit